ncbi:Na+/H+ antiporter NhaC, partial [Bacillus vallismortis]|nr:Na+/H+ antiporter NhaC [Bacillus vallismortis]
MDSQNKLTCPLAVGLFILMLGLIISCLFLLHIEPHIPLFLCVITLSAAGLWCGFPWKTLEKGMADGIKNCVQPIIDLALSGILIG